MEHNATLRSYGDISAITDRRSQVVIDAFQEDKGICAEPLTFHKESNVTGGIQTHNDEAQVIQSHCP